MKQNYVEEQYVQLAIEQFREVLLKVPHVVNIEINPKNVLGGFGDFAARVFLSDDVPPIDFCIDVKSNGEKRFINSFIQKVDKHKNDNICYVFAAPYVSDASASILWQKGYSYIDLSGNSAILTKQIVLVFGGQPNKFVKQKENKNYFSKSSSAASTVMRTILEKPSSVWQVKSLAELTGKAIGTVSNVKRFLIEHGWAEEVANGFKLCEIEDLLQSWAKEYPRKDSRSFEYYSLDSIPVIESKISLFNSEYHSNVTLSVFSAAARYAPTVRYKKVHVYVEQSQLEKFLSVLELKPVNSGGNIIITIPHDDTPCMFSRKINGDLVTSPVQTIIDLLGKSSRGEEAAEAIIQKEYKI